MLGEILAYTLYGESPEKGCAQGEAPPAHTLFSGKSVSSLSRNKTGTIISLQKNSQGFP